jgi:hemerythrin
MSIATDKDGHGSFVVEWREGFRSGIREIDAEHQHLFALVKGLDCGNAQALVDELLEYVVTHFTHEQALMEHSGYPDFHHHLALHEQLASQVSEFLAGGHGWSEQRVQELRRFLNKWLVGHILTHDLRFGQWYFEQARLRAARPAPAPARPVRSSWFDRLLGKR